MEYRTLGKTGIRVSTLSFGGGPISTLLVGEDGDRQRAVIARALECGINWFDTAATYGNGHSERNLGRVLEELRAVEVMTPRESHPTNGTAASRVYVATKARLTSEDLTDIRGAVRRSVEASLSRLRLSRVTLLQLHNSITRGRGDEPTSVIPADVLGRGGIAEVFEELRAEGLVQHLGLTGIGHSEALGEVVRSGRFETMQVPYHLLNPSAGRDMPHDFPETNLGNIIAECARQQMGVLAIRALAGGALAGNPPSPHTFKTPFFPLSLYERDKQQAARLRDMLGPTRCLPHKAIRFVLAHPQIHSAIIGFGDVWQIEEALGALQSKIPPLEWDSPWMKESSIGPTRVDVLGTALGSS
jgi:aryl-alcohol dehydrogenase-like predicted oxidoreductase